MLHKCSSCDSEQQIDCSVCKLDFLKEKKQETKTNNVSASEKDEYSISEEITKEGNGNAIFMLCVSAFLLFILVVVFSTLFQR